VNILSAFYESEVIVREEGDGRTLVGIVVPWDVATPVDSSGRFAMPNGTAWESFQRGALDKTLAEARKGIPMFGGRHPKSSATEKAAAVLTRSEALDDGQVAEFRLLRTYEGDEALENAQARLWTGFSLGYAPVPGRTVEGTLAGRKHFRRQEVRVDHVAFLRNPAYENAELLAMRQELEAADPSAAIRARARLRKLAYTYG
jgi:HK97 family phage prohead protease